MVTVEGEEEVGHAEGGEKVLEVGCGRVCLLVVILLFLLWVLHFLRGVGGGNGHAARHTTGVWYVYVYGNFFLFFFWLPSSSLFRVCYVCRLLRFCY